MKNAGRGKAWGWGQALGVLLALSLWLQGCAAAAVTVPRGCINQGSWVRLRRPRTYLKRCTSFQSTFRCEVNAPPGRVMPTGYKWVTHESCPVPPMNPVDMLNLLRNKVLLIIGDSLTQELFHSLVCSIQGLGLPGVTVGRSFQATRTTSISVSHSATIPSHNAVILFQFVQYLSQLTGKRGVDEVVRLDLPSSKIADVAKYAHFAVVSGGHWFNHQEGTTFYKGPPSPSNVVPSGLEAWPIAVATALRTLKSSGFRGPVIFKTYSPQGLGSPASQCGSTNWKPFTVAEGLSHITSNSWKTTRAFNLAAFKATSGFRPKVGVMDISWLTFLRQDAHVNKDCSHLCLAGVPDTWVDVLYQKMAAMARD